MPTDREYLKYQQAGALTSSGASNAIAEVGQAHSRTRSAMLTSSANAATNVSETPAIVLNRKSKTKSVKLTIPTTNVAANGTDYAVVKVYARDNAGANQVTLATYNTHSSANGALTLRVPAAFTLDTTNVTVNANSLITYEVLKYGSGKALDQYSMLDFDFEEV